MRLGIRAKLVLLLCATALLPLLVALVVFVTSGNRLRLKRLEETFLAVAASEAGTLEHQLLSDVKQFRAVLTEPGIVSAVAAIRSPRPTEEIEDIERRWPETPATAEPVAGFLSGPGSTALHLLQEANDHFKEVFITDRFGLLVSATNKTTDYLQSDETWWQEAADSGRGRVFVSDVEYDESIGLWSIEVGLPIYRVLDDDADPGADPGAEPARELVGVGKAIVGISAWLGELYRTVGAFEASVALVDRGGEIIFPRPDDPEDGHIEDWSGLVADGDGRGFRVTESGSAQAYVPVRPFDSSAAAPSWTLVLFTDEETTVEDIYKIGFRALGLGLVGIAVVFVLGFVLFDLNISRRVLRIAAVTRRVARGDLSARVRPQPDPDKRFGLDEIDELSVGFNDAVESVEQSHRRITAANELKKKFIQVAAHELRTPTTFIVGISRMLRSCEDATRLRKALSSIGAKADRLSHIVQSMFQLLPGGELTRRLEYTDVNTAELLEQLRRDVAPFLEDREVAVALDPGDVDGVRVDRATLLDALENLVTNAIRFTPDGGTVRVRVERRPKERVAFHITDQGRGIPESELPYLFEPFYSGEDVMHHSSGTGFRKRGIGLGLAVVKYLVELQGGTMEVTTSPQGTTMTALMPIRPPEPTDDELPDDDLPEDELPDEGGESVSPRSA